jgi:4-alpha-glucanotransferase
MDELRTLESLARVVGVHTSFTDGFGRHVTVEPETLVRVSAALGAPVTGIGDAGEAIRAVRAIREARLLPPVLIAWDGVLPPCSISEGTVTDGELVLDGGGLTEVETGGSTIRTVQPLPYGYHRLTVERRGTTESSTVISAPFQTWRRLGSPRSWGVGAQVAALRSARSRSVGDLRDLEGTCRWVGEHGADLMMVLPILPTFNSEPVEPSPYSPVSRLFWSELILDLGNAHVPTESPSTLDVTRADAEVRTALTGIPAPDRSQLDEELIRYARFRGAQARLGRNWRNWPAAARDGTLRPDDIDPEEERYHLVAQTVARQQLDELRRRLNDDDFGLGMDLAVGVHPDGYDTWSRQALFAEGMSVGAPPDAGFAGGQDWGFPPVLPEMSQLEGHRYIRASIAHQAALAAVLRIDHVMAWTRLFWIPIGFEVKEGTYVSYPDEELFAILCLESVRHECEVVGENLGTVPPQIDEALPRHRIWGMYLAQFEAWRATRAASAEPGTDSGPSTPTPDPGPPTAADVALIGTHDTPTLAGWVAGEDIEERARFGLQEKEDISTESDRRSASVRWLAGELGCAADDPDSILAALLEWLGQSDSPLVVPWLEDLWLEERCVNLPGTGSADRPNWQRPMRRLLDEVFTDPDIERLVRRLQRARKPASGFGDRNDPLPTSVHEDSV